MANPIANKTRHSFEEWLELEETSDCRHEFYFGEVFAMAGGTTQHNLINGNIFAALRPFARLSDCRVFFADVKLELVAKKYYVYPDIMYTCHSVDKQEPLIIRHPSLVIEVLSDSTEAYDLNTKLNYYTKLPSLVYYLVISQKNYLVQIFERKNNLWIFSSVETLENTVELPQLGIRLSMQEIYEGIKLSEIR
jgi:Uma2 family endonuclease